jgi:hypothetical protein
MDYIVKNVGYWLILRGCQYLNYVIVKRLIGKDLEESDYGLIEALSRNLFGGSEENHGNPQ